MTISVLAISFDAGPLGRPWAIGDPAQLEQMWTQLEQIVLGGVKEHERQTILRILEGLVERLTHATTDSGP